MRVCVVCSVLLALASAGALAGQAPRSADVLRSEARALLAKQVVPAYEKLLAFIRNEYLVKTRDTIAASKLPDGAAFYQARIEVDRYIAWPGQAVAYKLGELQTRRHRAEAEAALGSKFDQCKFHDAILGLGAVPLAVLDNAWRSSLLMAARIRRLSAAARTTKHVIARRAGSLRIHALYARMKASWTASAS